LLRVASSATDEDMAEQQEKDRQWGSASGSGMMTDKIKVLNTK
jgi:hypothetical protein